MATMFFAPSRIEAAPSTNKNIFPIREGNRARMSLYCLGELYSLNSEQLIDISRIRRVDVIKTPRAVQYGSCISSHERRTGRALIAGDA